MGDDLFEAVGPLATDLRLRWTLDAAVADVAADMAVDQETLRIAAKASSRIYEIRNSKEIPRLTVNELRALYQCVSLAIQLRDPDEDDILERLERCKLSIALTLEMTQSSQTAVTTLS